MAHLTDRKSNNGYGYGQYTALDVLQAKKSCEKDEQLMPHFDDRESCAYFAGSSQSQQAALAAIFGPLMC